VAHAQASFWHGGREATEFLPFETVFCDILSLYFVYIDNKKLLLNQMSVGSASEIFLTRKNAKSALPATVKTRNLCSFIYGLLMANMIKIEKDWLVHL
jgi:hypothetical protein